MRDRELDRTVIAALEMEEAVLAVGAPIAAVDRVTAEDVESAGDVVAATLCHDQHDLIGHALADQREEAPVQIGRAPLPVGGREIEPVEGVPDLLGEIRAAQHLDSDSAIGERLAPLFLHRLALP